MSLNDSADRLLADVDRMLAQADANFAEAALLEEDDELVFLPSEEKQTRIRDTVRPGAH